MKQAGEAEGGRDGGRQGQGERRGEMCREGRVGFD